MAYTLPSISELEEFMENVRSHAQNKRQKQMAEEVVGQFEKLVAYAKEATQELNDVDDADRPSLVQSLYDWRGET